MSHRGFIWFCLGLAIAFFFGGAIRVFSSKKNLDAWLLRHIQKERVQFNAEWKDIRLSLADGWLPAIGFELDELRIRPQDPCLVEGELFVDHANVSLDWWNWLIHGVIRVGKLRAHKVDVSWGESECVLSRWSSRSLESWRELFRKRWATELAKNRQWLESVHIEELHLQVLGHRPFDISFVDFDFHTGRTVKLGAQVRLPQVENAWVNIEADEAGFLLKSKISLKEGFFITEGKLSVKDESLSVDTDFQNVPFYSFLNLWNWWAKSSFDFKPRRLWVEGVTHLSVLFGENKISPLFIERLNVKGEAGHIQLNPFHWDLEKQQLTESLIFTVNKLSLSAFIDNLEQFLPKLGLLSGVGELNPDGKVQFRGLIENIEIYLFNLSVRARQSIASVNVELTGQTNQFLEAQFENFKIIGGELKDKVTWKWSLRDKKIEWNAHLSKLVLSQDVQRVLWGQVKEPLQGDLTLINQNDEWSMSGRLKIPMFIADQFVAKNLEFYKNQQDGLSPWKIKVQQLDLMPEQSLRARLAPWLPKEQYPHLSLVQITGSLEFGRDHWAWDDVRGQVASPKLNWKTKGRWAKTTGLHGFLESDAGTKKKFEILGGIETWELKPQDEMN